MICSSLIGLASQSPAVAALVGAAISILVEFWDKWEGLAHDVKRWIVLIMCLSVPLVSLFLGVSVFACAGMVFTADTFVTAIAIGCEAFAASQITHLYIRNHK